MSRKQVQKNDTQVQDPIRNGLEVPQELSLAGGSIG